MLISCSEYKGNNIFLHFKRVNPKGRHVTTQRHFVSTTPSIRIFGTPFATYSLGALFLS